jgi:hypothetical protein
MQTFPDSPVQDVPWLEWDLAMQPGWCPITVLPPIEQSFTVWLLYGRLFWKTFSVESSALQWNGPFKGIYQ